MCDNELEVTQLPKKRAAAQKIFPQSQKEECEVPFSVCRNSEEFPGFYDKT